MQRLSMLHSARNGSLTGLLLLMGALAGCGGGSDSPAASNPPVTPPTTPPAAVAGIATPSSVAVVTATNAE
jgi:hypothetical protein